MQKNKDYAGLKKFCQLQGADLFGVADIRRIKKDFRIAQDALEKVDRAVCLGLRLSSGILQEITQTPTRLYFHHYRTANAALDQLAFKVCNYIQKKGFIAIPIPASQIVDWQNQKAHLSHRELGVLAGLGWIGRNNLLVNKKLGSQFRLVSILTDMPLGVDSPTKENCASCRLCIQVCPAAAIKEDPSDFGYAACFAKLKEFQKQHLVEQFICGVCVRACRGVQR
jgi:epoxyqueuosine reductase QueG